MQVHVRDVSKSFARKAEVRFRKSGPMLTVLRDVTLEAEEGEIVCVLGKNGSGKTTLTRILSTLLEPDQGEARVCGLDTVRQAKEVRRRIGVMLNAGEGGFHPRLSALSNLEYYAALSQIELRDARLRIKGLLEDLGLGGRGQDQIQSYSSGMKRRIALIRALLPDAPVLLLDEPTLGIDPWSTEQIHNSLSRLANEGKTILCATNDPDEARALGHRSYVLDGGVLSPFRFEEVQVA